MVTEIKIGDMLVIKENPELFGIIVRNENSYGLADAAYVIWNDDNTSNTFGFSEKEVKNLIKGFHILTTSKINNEKEFLAFTLTTQHYVAGMDKLWAKYKP